MDDRSLPESARRRVVVADVRPRVDAGRHPVKRVVGDRLDVEADLVVDGHDLLAGVVRHRHESVTEWTESPLVAAPNDVFHGAFDLPLLGGWRYAVEGWVDAFASWRWALDRKLAAGADVSLELQEGAALVRAAAARAGDRGAWLKDAARALDSGPIAERVAQATSATLREEVSRFPDRSRATRSAELVAVVEPKIARCSAWYEMFPRSTADADGHGTFADAAKRLDYVAGMGFDIVYLPPIHPIGRTFRKGPDNTPEAKPGDPGSPWAIGAKEGGHTSVHPDLGTLADFDRLVARARELGMEIALDVAFQASPDHPWVKEHAGWFRARPDGSIQYAENPPKKYQDVYPFDFECEDWRALWSALRDVVLFWVGHGVRVFRVDNPHTKAIPFWDWCIRTVRERHPETVFLAEAFTRPKVMYALAKAGFSQSYTYFTWRTTKEELTAYMTELTRTEVGEFFRPNLWPTTPDIFPEHLVHGGRGAFLSRLVLASTLSSAYGIYGPSYELMESTPRPGAEELLHCEKYQVRRWDLTREDSLAPVVTRLNAIRRAHPALQDNRSLHFHPTSNELVLCYSKREKARAPGGRDDTVLVVVNLDPHHTHSAWLDLDLDALGLAADESFQVDDELGGAHFAWRGARNYVELDPRAMPAHVFALRRFVRTENQFEYFM